VNELKIEPQRTHVRSTRRDGLVSADGHRHTGQATDVRRSNHSHGYGRRRRVPPTDLMA
jgi:hypothetical protein